MEYGLYDFLAKLPRHYGHKMPPAKTALRISLRAATALIAVGVITLIFDRVIPVNATTVGFIYLVIILVVATAWGFIESTAASVAAMLCLNYFCSHREQDIEKLHSFSRAILLIDAAQPVPAQLRAKSRRVFDSPSVAIYDAQAYPVFRSGPLGKARDSGSAENGRAAWDEGVGWRIADCGSSLGVAGKAKN